MTGHAFRDLAYRAVEFQGSHVVSRCQCGWESETLRPADMGGSVSPWVYQWAEHARKAQGIETQSDQGQEPTAGHPPEG